MIHYTCDCCKRSLDTENETRYVVRVEVYAALEPEDERDDDRDHLQELQDILESIDATDEEAFRERVYHHACYDLCADCRQRFVKNPLGRGAAHKLDFSQN